MKFNCNTLKPKQKHQAPLIIGEKEWVGWQQWQGMGKVNHPGKLTEPLQPLSWRS